VLSEKAFTGVDFCVAVAVVSCFDSFSGSEDVDSSFRIPNTDQDVLSRLKRKPPTTTPAIFANCV